MNELTYTRCGDYYIPDLKLSEQPEAPIGKYGRMRQRYLKEHRPGLYSSLILSEKLYPHLLEIDRAARKRMDAMLPHMMEAAGVTEELKARDPMRWVGLMNTLKAQAEEIVLTELIYQELFYKRRLLFCGLCWFLRFRHIFCLVSFKQMKYNKKCCQRYKYGLHDT